MKEFGARITRAFDAETILLEYIFYISSNSIANIHKFVVLIVDIKQLSTLKRLNFI